MNPALLRTANVSHVGFKYLLRTVRLRDMKVLDEVPAYNLVPIQGLNYLIATGLKQGVAFPNFYVGLFEGDYTPVPGDVMADFPANATELTAYTESQRRPLVLGDVANGMVDNTASLARFTGNTAGKQAMGGFISSAPVKGAGTGILMSAARFPSPRPLETGLALDVIGSFVAVSI